MISLVFAGVVNGQTVIYFTVACGGVGAHFVWQFFRWDIENYPQGEAMFVVSF